MMEVFLQSFSYVFGIGLGIFSVLAIVLLFLLLIVAIYNFITRR